MNVTKLSPEADFIVEPAQGLQPSGICRPPPPWARDLLSLCLRGLEQIMVHHVQKVFTGGMNEGRESSLDHSLVQFEDVFLWENQ